MAQVMDHDRFQELLWSFAAHRVITVAGRTGVLGALAEKCASTDALAGQLGLAPKPLRKLVAALAALGVAERGADGSYRLAEALAPLFAQGGTDFTAFLEHSHDMYTAWGENLEAWVRGGDWSGRQRDAAGIARFGAAMRAMGEAVAERVAEAVDLSAARRLIDLGGGVGQHAEAFCRANPGLAAVVVDIPEVARLGRERVAGTEMEPHIAFEGGDYIEGGCGGGFDLALLANVLHQEPADRAAAMVARAASELAPGGRLLIVDFTIEGEPAAIPVGALFAINMRSRGDTYGESALRDFAAAAGLERFSRTDVGRHRAAWSAWKPLG
jgi:SAM-dependent methyltransferase